MVDWDRVERLRSRGWDWDRIAADQSVDFHADSAAGDPGRALRVLYFQRRSKSQRRGSGGGAEGGGAGGGKGRDDRPRWGLLRAFYIVTPLLAVWFVLALVFPSPVGVYVDAIPDLAIGLFAAAAVLAFALFRSVDRWTPVFRNSVIVGLILGLVLAGGIGLVAISQGCPNLSSAQSTEPQSWTKAANAPWTQNGAPVFYFFGAIACPYCSASSWSMWYALSKMGSVSGVQYNHSSSVDIDPNTPEIVIDALTVQSSYVSLVAAERHDPTLTEGPALSSCVEQAYVSAYDQNGIPFIVINGQYVHQGSLFDPAVLAGMSPQQVMGQIQNQSGTAWNAISGPAYMMMAIMVKCNGGQPSSVAQIQAVQQDLSQLS